MSKSFLSLSLLYKDDGDVGAQPASLDFTAASRPRPLGDRLGSGRRLEQNPG